ncbi:hypothetical protein PspLS_09108, partial [Pyricularia sp. CBS 133598]
CQTVEPFYCKAGTSRRTKSRQGLQPVLILASPQPSHFTVAKAPRVPIFTQPLFTSNPSISQETSLPTYTMLNNTHNPTFNWAGDWLPIVQQTHVASGV